MNKVFRIIILLSLLLGAIGLAQSRVAWAQPATKDEGNLMQGVSFDVLGDDDDDDGSVKPPPKKVRICKRGTFSVGGGATVKVKSLDDDYCIIATLQKRNQFRATIPSGAGRILSEITLIRIRYKNHFVGSLPANDGHVDLCYAVPPGKHAAIYYLDQKNHTWQPVSTTLNKHVACTRIYSAGYYALIGK